MQEEGGGLGEGEETLGIDVFSALEQSVLRPDSPCSQEVQAVLRPIMLAELYRMLAPIASFPSMKWYGNELDAKTRDIIPREEILHLTLMQGSREELDGHSSFNTLGNALPFFSKGHSPQFRQLIRRK